MPRQNRGSAWRRNTVRPRHTLRLSIYARDHFACVYCGQLGTVDGLCVDHVVADGGNAPSNLITSCFGCNRLKQSLGEDLRKLAERLPHRSTRAILAAVAQQQATPLTPHTRAVARRLAADKPDWLLEIRRLSDQRERAKIPF